MIKVFSASGWDFEGPSSSLIKMASGGLRGNDRRDFIKRASGTENIFLPFLDGIKWASGERPAHYLAVGAEEAWGGNRNGDTFEEQHLKQAHDTFVKFGRVFRNHKNKPHEGHNHYGSIKMSAYNPAMRRVELLVGLYETKEAADRDGTSLGLVADKELEKLAKGEDLAGSMACRVPYDVCSACGNKARTRDEYCKEASCWAGGCTDNLTRLIKRGNDVHHLRVRNPNPHFFDWSGVWRPAERTAYGNAADYLTKAASDGGLFEACGAKMAEDLGLVAPLSVILAQDMLPGGWDERCHGQIKLAHGLDVLDRTNRRDLQDEVRLAFDPGVQAPVDFAAIELDPAQPTKMAAAFGAMADEKIVLPLREFARLTKRAELAGQACTRLRGIYGRMITDGSLERRISRNPYAPAEKLASAAQRTQAKKIAPDYSLEKSAVATRASRATLRQLPLPSIKVDSTLEKQAADNPAAEELARDYAVYKLSALHRIASFDIAFPLTARLGACQNAIT